jgi:hypothetical protein
MVDPVDPEGDGLDRFLASCRPTAPEGLAARVAAAAWDPRARRRHYWQSVADSSRGALKAASVLLALSVGLSVYARAGAGSADRAPSSSDEVFLVAERDAAAPTVDQVAFVTASGSSLALRDPGEGE